MPSNTYDELVRTENRHKEKVYGAFDAMRSEASATVASKKKYVDSGAYEDHSSFMAYGSLATAEKHRKTVDVLVQSLYHSPYFAHIDLQGLGNFFLSDCESLDEAITIDGNGMLIPFKRDSQRPISEALHKCYQQKNGAEVTYISPGGKVTCQPKLICDDHIENRTLVSVTPFYPEQEQFHVDADELLDKKLQENRNDPALQNIISTLQREQFRIISADTSVSFIVQGCAGSGKSQCLLHLISLLCKALRQQK